MMNQMEQRLFALLGSEQYETRIRKAGIFRFPSNYRFESHAHREYEINYINTGCCIMGVEENYVPLRQGECIVIAPGQSHCFMVDMQKACKITQLEAVIRFPEAMAEGLPFPAMDSPYCKLHGCEKLLPLLERISYFHRAGELSEADQVQLDFGLLELYAMLTEEFAGQCGGAEDREKEMGQVGEIIRHIHENLDQELNMEELAAEYGISSRYVRRFFQEQMGMGSNEYITMLRIGRAKQLLWRPEYSVTEVALMSGFSSSQYFCRVFRRQTGTTPAEYRKLWRENAV